MALVAIGITPVQASVPASIRPTVFDQHVLKGNHFRFLGADYELKPLSSRQTLLILSSDYVLDTRINGYAAFWGNQMLADFQERLLAVIRNRCENRAGHGPAHAAPARPGSTTRAAGI